MSERGRMGLREAIALTAIGAVALAVRLFFMRDWLNYDEAQHFLIAQSPLWSDFLREFQQRAHPPLAYLAMKPFVMLGTSAGWVRAAPMLAGLAGIGIAYALLRRTLRGFWPAVLGTSVIALLPLLVQQSIVARQYSVSILFVWLALYFAAGIALADEGREQTLRNHLLLAAAQFGALMTEYTTVLAIVPLSAVIYLPIAFRLLRQHRHGQLASLAGVQLAVAVSGLLMFGWHFEGSVPHFPHTEGDTYLLGLTAGVGPLFEYLAARIPRLIDGLFPQPWGSALLVLAWLPLTPLFRSHPRAPLARAAALCSLLSVALLIALAAAGALPIGGMPRHNVSLLPALIVSAIASCALALSLWTSPGGLRTALATGLVALSLPGVITGWQRLSPHRNNFYNLCGRARVPEYLANPVPVVSNNRGRSLLSWYFLPDRPARQVSHLPFWDRYDYGGVPVVETPIDRMMLESVIELAREHGEVWVLYSDLAIEPLKATYAHLKVGVRDSPHVRMRHSELSKSFVLPSILARVERVQPER